MENNASQEKFLKILNPFLSNGVLNTFCITFVGLPITGFQQCSAILYWTSIICSVISGSKIKY